MEECECEELGRPVCWHKWTADAESIKGERKVFVQHFGTGEDVRLYVNGDFGGEEEEFIYAKKIAEALNKVMIDG